MHLLIPAAHTSSEQLARSAQDQALPALQALLGRLRPVGRIETDEFAWSMPAEIARAQALGLPAQAGHIPWAAFETQTYGTPCAFIKPCYWDVHVDHIKLAAVEGLALDHSTSEACLQAMQPYFEEDGLQLSHLRAGLWLASGEVFRQLPTASTDRVLGRNIDAWMPAASAAQGGALRRLQNEMQMLLYTHPLNDERVRHGLPPVNSFWVTGAGVLAHAPAPQPAITVEPRLATAAAQGDPQAYALAWAAVDCGPVQELLEHTRAGAAVQITLCGERAAQTWGSHDVGVWQRFVNQIRPKPLKNLIDLL